MAICQSCNRSFIPSRHSAGKFCSGACYRKEPRKRIDWKIRFWNYVSKSDGCWNWTGAHKGAGRTSYGTLAIPTGSASVHRNFGAHRLSWVLHFGEIPEGMLVCHKCDNPPCVRPDHLFLGSARDNMCDAVHKGRKPAPDNRGSKHGMSKLTEDKVRAIRSLYIPRKHGNRAKLAEQFGVSVTTINQVIWNLRWKHV